MPFTPPSTIYRSYEAYPGLVTRVIIKLKKLIRIFFIAEFVNFTDDEYTEE